MIDINCLKYGKELFRKYFVEYRNEYDALLENCESKVKTKVFSKVNSYPIIFDLCEAFAHNKFNRFSVISKKPKSGNYSEHYYDEKNKLIFSSVFEDSRCVHIEVLIRDTDMIAVLSFDQHHFLYKIQITTFSSNIPTAYICCTYRKFSGYMMDCSNYVFDDRMNLRSIETSYNRLLIDETDEELLSYDSCVEKCLADESLLSVPWSTYNLECTYTDSGILSEIRTYENHSMPKFISCENITQVDEKSAFAFKKIIADLLKM